MTNEDHNCGSGASRLHFALRVENAPHILAAYGEEAASQALQALRGALSAMSVGFQPVGDETTALFLASFAGSGPHGIKAGLEAALARFSMQAVPHDEEPIYLALSWAWSDEDGECAQTLLPSSLPPQGEGELWIGTYREDMAVVATALAALAEGRLTLAWQPVLAADAPEKRLYHEALTRLDTGEALSGDILFPALERLGFARIFDRQVMALVLDELERFPAAVIGVNVSGSSAALDGWWFSLFERLERNPSLAARLVAEITETTQMAENAVRFVAELRKYGCRIALDDFGVGHASIRNAMMIDPDIVKVDAYFMRNAAHSDEIHDVLRHLTGIAASIAPEVIIEGIENEAESRLAMEIQSELAPQSNGCWQQGYLFGRPSPRKPW